MKRTFRTLSCATLLVAAAHSNAQDPLFEFPSPPSNGASVVGDEPAFVGDQFDSVGDLDVDGGAGQIGDLVGARATDSESFVGDTAPTEGAAVPQPTPEPTPVMELPMSAAPHTSMVGEACPPRMFKVRKKASKWLRYDTLLWFAEERDTPPLITTGVGQANQFGDPITSGLAPGFRVDYGHYFGDGTVGLGLRISGLFGEDEDYQISSNNAANVIGRPFFDINAPGGPQPNSFIISGLGPTTGSFSAVSEFDYFASEVYGRLNFDKSTNYSIDLIGGFSAFAIDDMLALTSTSDQGGTRSTLRDVFDTENRFYGGQLGIETMFHKGNWSLTTLTKVHLGNMNNRVAIAGSSRQAILPDPPGPGTNFANGFFAQGQQGVYEEDDFAFAPELGLRLGYSPRSNVELTVGYTFIYWSDVALAGNQINPYLDGTLILSDVAGPQAPLYEIESDGFWLQGIDLGVVFHY